MDFALTEEQQAIVDLARQILSDRCTPEHLKEVESGTDWFDRETWSELAKAGLLGIPLPDDAGGAGFGFLEACLLLQEQGRTVAPLPLLSTLIGSMAVAAFGTEDQRHALLPGVVDGETVLALALAELDAEPIAPALRAVSDGVGGWTLHGVKTTVSAEHLAADLIVPARDDDGRVVVFLVPAGAPGVVAERQDTFNREPQFHVSFDGTVVHEADVLGADRDGAEVVRWIVDRATVGLCALMSGIADAGMRLTAQYVTGRHQFDRPIGSFQAVGHRMADCFVDNQAIELSMLAAASRLAEGRRADKEVAVAKYWASYSGNRIGHADLHLHGGISIDLDYPIHRYFLWSKHLEYALGSASPQLASLGAALADEPVGAV
ncbi:MAG: acyl-CoA/acyl-ACP dehydrogenase [Acidimicrobiales bacterium]|jgi:alkylation response protein AidB-like acyl-CoA dehydrogenase|nr:acyl-CoA/acyl-ACP dehydrogenase [Acidimicrobiales bacterium]